MAGTPRSAKVWGALEARAKAMRREGASMAEIERETGVPAPTLHQWAARGGWRLCDLEEERENLLSSPTSVGSVLAPGEQGSPARSVSEDRLSGREGGQGKPQGPQGEQPPAASARTRHPGGAGGQEPIHSASGREAILASGGTMEGRGLGEKLPPQLGEAKPEIFAPHPTNPQGHYAPARLVGELALLVARMRLTGPLEEEKPSEPDPSQSPNADDLRAISGQARAEAVRLYQAGLPKAAREQLLTAQRFERAAEASGGPQKEAASQSAEAGYDPRQLLLERLERYFKFETEKYATAQADGTEAAYLAIRDTDQDEGWRGRFWWPWVDRMSIWYTHQGGRALLAQGGCVQLMIAQDSSVYVYGHQEPGADGG